MKGINVVCRPDVLVNDKSLPCIAVDSGLLYAIENKLNIIKVIGDFDSLDNKEYENYQDILVKFPKEKNKSDLELTIETLKDYPDPIYIYGALGKRQDHNLVNLKLCYYSDLNIHLIDEYNEIYCLKPGKHYLIKNNYKYISFMTFLPVELKLIDFKYPLDNYLLKMDDNLTLSNEFIKKKGIIENKERILVILSQDRKIK